MKIKIEKFQVSHTKNIEKKSLTFRNSKFATGGGILRGAAKKKKGQKKGRVVYKYVFGLLYEVFPIYRRDFTGPGARNHFKSAPGFRDKEKRGVAPRPLNPIAY